MARYIDADAIHKFVDEKVAEGKDGWRNGVPYEWAYALTVIDNAPTADVVPKSEVEELKQIYRKYNKAIKNERSEVAREIFEEIEKKSCVISETNHSTGSTRVVCYQISAEKLAELKKKYTEGEPNGSKQ